MRSRPEPALTPRPRPAARAGGEGPFATAIDCDTGIDDALALLAAVGSPALDIELVTTVAGNAPVERTTENTLRVLALAGRPDIPVYQGASRPLARDLATGAAVHGERGLAGPELPPSPAGAVGDAQDALGRWCAGRGDRPKRLVAIGPLTNIGGLLASNPDALAGVDELFIMGGSLSGMGGALSPNAETNVFIDPEAARLVLHSGAKIRLFDYDATTACLIAPHHIDEIAAAIPADITPYVKAWLNHLYQVGRIRFGREGVAAHDLYTVLGAAGHSPGYWELARLDVGTDGPERGVVKTAPGGSEVGVARGLDPAAMVAAFVAAVSRLR